MHQPGKAGPCLSFPTSAGDQNALCREKVAQVVTAEQFKRLLYIPLEGLAVALTEREMANASLFAFSPNGDHCYVRLADTVPATTAIR